MGTPKLTAHECATYTIEYEWEPGDATRYHLILTRIGNRVVFAWVGATRDGAGHCMTLYVLGSNEIPEVPHWSYVGEKMGVTNAYDAQILTRFLMENLPAFLTLNPE